MLPASIGVGSSVQIGFAAGSAKLDKSATTKLKHVSGALKTDPDLRIQLLAYAGAMGNSASQARRLSLSRALAARSILIGDGIKSTRIDVRALGDKSTSGPPDRVDIIVTKR
jgi:outer membrane protein OmpA-like peptidoglycan-associated protein